MFVLCMCLLGPVAAYIGLFTDFMAGFGVSHGGRELQGWDAFWVSRAIRW